MSDDLELAVTTLIERAADRCEAGDYGGALNAAKQVLALARVHEEVSGWTAFALHTLATIYERLERWTDAEGCYIDMAVVLELIDPSQPALAAALAGRGSLCAQRGRDPEAMHYLEGAIAHAQRYGEHAPGALALNLSALGDVVQRLGTTAGAAHLRDETIEADARNDATAPAAAEDPGNVHACAAFDFD